MSDLKNVSNDLKILTNNSQTWIQKHERLIIVVLIIALGIFIAQKYFDLSARIEDHKAQEAAQTLSNQKATTDNDVQQVKQLLTAYQTALLQSSAQNAQLQKLINQRNLDLTKQQKADTLLSPSDLAQRWIAKVNDPGIVPATSGYNVSSTAALATVQVLEQVPVLQQNLKDEQAKEVNLQKDITAANDLVTKGKETAASIQLQMQDQEKACTAQVAAVKADARKSKLKWFGAGVVVGFVMGHIW